MDELIQKEIALHQIEIRTDKGEASRLLHPDFLEVGKSGKTFDFNLIMESMSKEKPTGSVVHSQDYECISLEANTNLLLYRSAVINNDGAIGSYAKRSSVWVKFRNEWKLRYHQGTPCEEFQLSK